MEFRFEDYMWDIKVCFQPKSKVLWKSKNPWKHSVFKGFRLAPPAGLEPATTWLTVRCSTDWAKEEYWVEWLQGKHFGVSLIICRQWPIFPIRRQISIFGTAELNFRVRNGNGWTLCVNITDSLPRQLSEQLSFTEMNLSSLLYVSIDLFSRSVARQVFSALQSLTSVFGMGTGGPSALKWPTFVSALTYLPGPLPAKYCRLSGA